MTNKILFSFIDYKAYLLHCEQKGEYKGFRTRLAESTGCQNAFISQVFNSSVNFNLEQALKISIFLKFNEEETQFFLWMVEFKRAGTQDLKKYFHNLLTQLKEKNLNIKNRIQIQQVLAAESQNIYYSSWIYSAVHVAAMIPNLNTVERISLELKQTKDKIQSVIDFLIQNDLLVRKGNQLFSGKIQIHLSKDSPNIIKHHSNWRIQALNSLDEPTPNDIHYSGVSSLSIEDATKIKSKMIDFIEDYVKQIERSKEETLCVFNLDFFKLC
jgi:uncharacterized protein (TIGR02147 family)